MMLEEYSVYDRAEREQERNERLDYLLNEMQCPKCNARSRNGSLCKLCWPTCLNCMSPAKSEHVRICRVCDVDLCKQCYFSKSKKQCTCPVLTRAEQDRIVWLNNMTEPFYARAEDRERLIRKFLGDT